MKKDINIAVITVDSLRWDVSQMASAPNFDAVFKEFKAHGGGWRKVGAHGTYTLPSHIALFKNGCLPNNNRQGVPAPYNVEEQKVFRLDLGFRTKETLYMTPPAPNIIKGFEKMGYRTIGIGGVGWFNTNFVTSSFWEGEYFSEFYFNGDFRETCESAFENQINFTNGIMKQNTSKLFYFLNIASTHYPYMNKGRTLEGQKQSFEYVDSHIRSLLDLMPRPCHVLILSDHGDCFGEDGLWSHAIYHPKVMEVPMVSFIME